MNVENFSKQITDLADSTESAKMSKVFDARVTNDEIKVHYEEKNYNPDKRIDSYSNKYISTFEERLSHAPKYDTDLGSWQGERGNSKFVPSDELIKESLAKYETDGIEYKDAIPNFDVISKQNVEIDMTAIRYYSGGNFDKADHECATAWNNNQFEGKNDWTARDIKEWRHENRYTWHECSDRKTCQLVPMDIHKVCTHTGGIFECKKLDAIIAFGGNTNE